MIKNLSSQDLNLAIKNLVSCERALTTEILHHIVEVECRKLYLQMAYPSLFDYLTKEIGYSAGAAQRRIDSARLLIRFPEMSEKIQEGRLSLSQISKFQRACRQIKRERGQAMSVEQQRSTLQKLENLGSTETDLLLAQEFQMKVEDRPRQIIQRDESVRMELTFSKDEMEIIAQARALLSNQTGGDLKATLVLMAQQTVRAQSKSHMSTATVAVKHKSQHRALRSVTPSLKRMIRVRDAQKCQFRDPQTDRQCGSNYFLEVDHIKPRFAEGKNTPENLRLLCRAHNQFRYRHRRSDHN